MVTLLYCLQDNVPLKEKKKSFNWGVVENVRVYVF